MKKLLLIYLVLFTGLSGGPVLHDVRAYGAKGDGVAKDTPAIQAAVDQAAKQGGGIVLFPAGKYLSGTIHLRSNITIELAPGATLLASTENEDFDKYETLSYESHADAETTYFHYALLAGEDIQNIAIVGQGIIDGNRTRRRGPKTIALRNCRRVSIRGITVQNAPNYSISFLGSDYIDVDGVTVLNGYSDGIDFDSSRFARVANSFVDSWDDAICLKASPALGYARSTENVTVTNCILSTACNNFKLGTESSGDFKNIAFTNSTMFPRASSRRPISGIAIETVDGAHVDGLVVSNITMRDVNTPVFVRLGNRGRAQQTPTPGSLENVSISNVVATGANFTCSITGLPGHPVRRVSLDNIHVAMNGGNTAMSGGNAAMKGGNAAMKGGNVAMNGGNAAMKGATPQAGGLDVPEVPAKYPEATMFGVLPACGFYSRHAEGLTFRNVHTRWLEPDSRPAFIFDDVKDLTLDGVRAESVADGQFALWLHQVSGALIHGSRVPAGAGRFLRVTGPESGNIKLLGNDLGRSASPLELGPEVSRHAVFSAGNSAPPETGP